MHKRSAEILIIGAGISGITAASKLIAHGFTNITILEAENRIGGRIESVKFSDGFIDFGAQWCSGEKGNSLYELCHDEFDFGMTGYDVFQNFTPFTSDGRKIEPQKLEKLYALKNKIEEMTEEMRTSSQSAGEFFEERFFKALRTSEYSDIDEDLCDMFLSLWHRQTNAIYAAASWYDLSAPGFASNILCEGRQYLTWRTFGSKSMFDIILKKFSGSNDRPIDLSDKIRLNKKVTNINWKSNNCIIETSDRSVYHADHVIVTIPLGVLQAHHKTLFNPKLPASKVSAIENMRMGTLNKVFLEFEVPFWTNDLKLSSFIWTKSDMKEIIETDKEWLLNIYGFLHVDGFPHLLETVLSGNKTKEFESYSDAKVESDCMWLLEKFLRKKLPRPIAMRRTRWSSRENFLGSYAYLSMQSTANNISPSDLAEPICNADGKPVLLFAGEATCPRYQGYAHGALDSGKRAAQEIIEFYTKVIGISRINKL